MINLITGLPGAGKTLWTITELEKVSKADNRPVFYAGINGVTNQDWTEIKAEEWFNCPAGSLIVIDECQTVFRPRTISKEVPKYVSELETHRHKGLDLFLLTQHPMLADTALRRLSGRHIHVVRAFGMQGSMLHEWPSVKDNCDKSAGRVDSIKTRFAYPKSSFGLYKSAEIHTVKRRIPFMVKLLMLMPFVLAAAGYFFYKRMDAKIHPVAATLVKASDGTVTATPAGGGLPQGDKKKVDARADAEQFVFDRTPRIVNLPQSAPRYDELTKPTAVPTPAACINSAKGCKCYTQQGTIIGVSNATCVAIVDNGFFQDFDDSPRRRESVSAPQLRPASYSPTEDKKIIRNIVASNDNGVQLSSSNGETNANPTRRGTVSGRSRLSEGSGPTEAIR